MKKCTVCSTILTGSQKKFCSKKCCSKSHKSSRSQKNRAYQKKLKLVNLMGGSCTNCGYNKNFSALVFHHKDPNLKKFSLDSRTLANRAWHLVLEESKKCILLCHNCHSELHNPDCLTSNYNLEYVHKPTVVDKYCISCGKKITKSATRCAQCQGKTQEKIAWPKTQQLQQMVSNTSYRAVGELLGVSDVAVKKRIVKYLNQDSNLN